MKALGKGGYIMETSKSCLCSRAAIARKKEKTMAGKSNRLSAPLAG